MRRTGAPLVVVAGLIGIACAAGIAASRGTGTPAAGAKPRATFDSSRAFEHIRQLTAIGPRPAGTPAALETRRYITSQFQAMGVALQEQPFTVETPIGTVRMANLIATVPGASKSRIVIGGHYDTKLFREFRFVGANDGGSSTAMLIELGRALRARSNPFTIELVFFDGEEAFVEWIGDDHTYGSRHYVDEARRTGTLESIEAMILLDMVGDRGLAIRREQNSTPWLTDLIWGSAKRLGYSRYFPDLSQPVEDDHMPFLRAGVPAVDLIDSRLLSPPTPWHTAEDTLDKVSARSLQVVGDVVLDALPAIEARLKAK